MALFTPRVRVSNVWGRSKRSEHGYVMYETPYKYRIRFLDHTRYLLKPDVRLVDQLSPPRALIFGSSPEAPVENVEVSVEDASVAPLDVKSGGTKSGLEGVRREPYGDAVKCGAPV
jgi:hypothetical protein